MRIEEIIRSEIKNFLLEWDDDFFYDLIYERDEIMRNTIESAMNASPNDRQPWSVVPFARLKKVWEDAAKYGFVRDEKGLNMIQSRMLTNLLKLDVNTELLGHSQSYPDEYEFEDAGTTREAFEEKMEENYWSYFDDPNSGHARISDYGLKPLWQKAQMLSKEKDPMKRLSLLDQMLNVVHMRSDIAAMFVEGGSNALTTLSGEHGDREWEVHRPA